MTGRLGLRGMLAAGPRALRAHARLALALYLVQLAAAWVVGLAVAGALGSLYGREPLFDRAVGGDVGALATALAPHAGSLTALLMAGAAVALAYLALSWYLGAGLLGALRGQPFGDTAGRRFWAFGRLWFLSLVPLAVAGLVAVIGASMAAGDAAELLAWRDLAAPVAAALPGLALLACVACAIDLARVRLAAGARRSVALALLDGATLVYARPAALAHYLVYALTWAGVTALYLALAAGRPFAGAAGAVGLLVLRQATAALRFLARFGASAGQVALDAGEHAEDDAGRAGARAGGD